MEIGNAAQGLATTSMALMMMMMVMMMIVSRTMAQSNGCSSVMMTLSPCLDYIGSKSPEPGLICCNTLANVAQSDPRCLCMVLDGSAVSFGIVINHTRALELPGICKVKTPPISRCTGIPDSPPVDPPSEPPAPREDAEDTAHAPKGITGSNTKSSSRNSKNAASLIATMLIPAFALLCVF